MFDKRVWAVFLLASLSILSNCGGAEGGFFTALKPLEPCEKGQIRTSTRNGSGEEVLKCLTKCWHDWQCVGDDVRCQDSVCVHLACLPISDASECERNINCYWHKAAAPDDIARCSSGVNADISISPP